MDSLRREDEGRVEGGRRAWGVGAERVKGGGREAEGREKSVEAGNREGE